MKITWTFTVEEANYVLAALGERPFNQVSALLMRMKVEADMQVAPPVPPEPELKPEPELTPEPAPVAE